MVKVVSQANFGEILSSANILLVDFSATWCGPCRMLSPTVDEIADELEGKVTVAKCNVDDCEEIAMQFSIRNIPTLLYFKNGELLGRTVGVVSKKDILDKINSL